MVTTIRKSDDEDIDDVTILQTKARAETGDLIILTGKEVDKVLSTLEPELAIQSQSEVFKSFSAASSAPSAKSESPSNGIVDVQTPHRTSLSNSDVTSLFMPSLAGPSGMGLKIVSIPKAGQGLPATTVLVDERTGGVKAMINARKLTALRNAAGSALFLKAFPHPRPPTNLLIFGTGAQAHAHVTILLKTFTTFSKCTIIGRRETPRALQLAADLQVAFPAVEFTLGIYDAEDKSFIPYCTHFQGYMPELSGQDVKDAKAAPIYNKFGFQSLSLSQHVHNANVIVTLTPSKTPLFNSVDVTSQTRLILVGSYTPQMKEVPRELVHRAGMIVVDSKESCLKEAGELIDAGLTEDGVVELGQCLTEESRGIKVKVEESGDVVLFKSVGIGIQDIAIANVILQQARAKGLGTVIKAYD